MLNYHNFAHHCVAAVFTFLWVTLFPIVAVTVEEINIHANSISRDEAISLFNALEDNLLLNGLL